MKNKSHRFQALENLRQTAELQLASDPQVVIDPLPVEERKLLHELQVHQIELEMQNNSLQEARAAAEVALERSTELFDFAPIAYFTLGRDSHIQQTNFLGAALLNSERSKVIGQIFAHSIAARDRAKFNRFLKDVFEDEISKSCEITLQLGETLCYIAIEARTDRTRQFCLAAVLNITERKQAEALKESCAFNIAILNSVKDEIAVLDQNGTITAVNTAWQNFTRNNSSMANQSILGINVGENYLAVLKLPNGSDSINAKAAYEGIQAVIEGRLPNFSLEYSCHSPEKQRWFKMNVTPFLSSAQTGVVVMHTDISINIEHQRIETALKWESEKNVALLNNATDGITLMNPAGELIEVSDSFCTLMGYSREELIGMHVSQWDVDIRTNEQMKVLKKQFEQPVRTQFETRLQRKDSTIFDAEISGYPIEFHGKPVLLNSTRDISLRKQSERALAESEYRYRTLIQNTSDAILIFDMNGKLEEINRAGEKMLGYRRNEVYTITAQQMQPITEQIQRIMQFEPSAKNEYIAPYETKILCNDKQLLEIEVRTTLIKIKERKLVQSVFIDLTQRKQLENERMAAHDLQRETLIREVHHRIKNNLQGITGILRNFALTHPEIASPINYAVSQVHSISVTYGLQGLSNTASVRACELTQHIAADIELIWNKPITVEIPTDWTPCIVATKETVPLALILNELISNAVKHSQSDAGVRILLRHGSRPDSIVLTIHNTGLLPINFGLNENCLGNGLQLVKSLLPHAGAGIHWLQQENTVITTLELDAPIINLESERLSTHDR